MATKKRITKKMFFIKSIEIIKLWLRLQNWKISVKFVASMKNTAYCTADPEYRIAKIYVNLTHIKSITYNEVAATALHELLHCIVWPLGEWATRLSSKDKYKIEISRRYEEEVVTNLEQILIPLLREHINNTLIEEGYEAVNLEFTDFSVTN